MRKLLWMALQGTVFVLFLLPLTDVNDHSPNNLFAGVLVAYVAAYTVTAAPLALVDWCRGKLAQRKARMAGQQQA